MTVIARDDVTLALVTDVASTAHYFQLKASTASAPSAPTAYPAPSPWVTTEPTYTEGATNSLYTVDVTVFSDGSFDYTPVSLSSSYEAAKAAYNKARQAQSSATSAQTAANLALANTQELVINGGFETGDLTGWTASGVAVLSGWDQDYPHSGKYQARFAAGASCSQSINGLVSGHIIRCSFWQRGFDGRTATMTISFNGGTEQTVGSITGVAPYTRAFKDFTVPANTTTATIKLTCDTNYIRFDDISVKDITEAQAAQKAADDAQSAATAAQTTADGKNKIFSSASKPSSKGIVPGDLWFQLDSNQNVSGIQVWNGSTFTDMVLLANELLVASSVGTTQIADNAIVTGKIAANAITAIKIAARTITGDKLDVGSVAAAIVTSGLFQTAKSGARVVMDSNGISAYDSSNALTFKINAANGNVTSNGGTFTGSTFRTNSGSDRTEMNNAGITVYNGGNAYAHMGSDATYGLSLWDPVSQTMSDASSMIFGTIYYQSEAYLSTKIFTTTGDAPWFFDDANTAVITPTGRIMVSFSFSNDNTADNQWSTLVMGQVFVTSSPHGQHSQDDWQIQSNGWVGETRELRTGPGNFGLLPASRMEIISGLPKNVPLYPCLGIRGHGIVSNGTRWSISVRLRTIVANPC